MFVWVSLPTPRARTAVTCFLCAVQGIRPGDTEWVMLCAAAQVMAGMLLLVAARRPAHPHGKGRRAGDRCGGVHSQLVSCRNRHQRKAVRSCCQRQRAKRSRKNHVLQLFKFVEPAVSPDKAVPVDFPCSKKPVLVSSAVSS